MVSATSPEVTRMVMASGTNKWASRAVVILQLAAWSAVGVVLLQKGVSSLQKRPTEARNVTQVISTKSPGIYRQNNQKDLLVIPIVNEENSKTRRNRKLIFDENTWNESVLDKEFLNDQESSTDDIQNIHRTISEYNNEDHMNESKISKNSEVIMEKDSDKELSKKELIGKKLYPSKKTVRTKSVITDESKHVDEFNTTINNSRESLPIKMSNDGKFPSTTVDINESQRQSTKTAKIPLLKNSQQSINSNQTIDDITNNNDKTTSSSPTTTTTTTTKSGGTWESRRRLRLSHLSGGGAAAAVAMVAVGAVMLVLGPAVIVLRALDERRQERRFLKLSGRDDLPPSYEQATLMDEAPRYSSLSLNTILGPPPPPSPTPTRIQIV